MQNVLILETKELKELEITDPDTGQNWINDLLAHGDSHRTEDGIYHMSKDEYIYWHNLTSLYQQADDRNFSISSQLGDKQRNELHEAICNISCPLEDYSQELNKLCDQYEKYVK